MVDPESKAPLGHLREEVVPPARLSDRVVTTLTGRGLLRRPAGLRAWGLLAAGLAGLVLFGAGVVAGRSGLPHPGPGGQRFALLLYDPPTFDRSIPESSLVVEYRDWARGLGDRLSLGEKLGDQARVLPVAGRPGAEEGEVLGGFFIVFATDWQEAMAIAASCPHLRHGGIIRVRAIEAT